MLSKALYIQAYLSQWKKHCRSEWSLSLFLTIFPKALPLLFLRQPFCDPFLLVMELLIHQSLQPLLQQPHAKWSNYVFRVLAVKYVWLVLEIHLLLHRNKSCGLSHLTCQTILISTVQKWRMILFKAASGWAMLNCCLGAGGGLEKGYE